MYRTLLVPLDRTSFAEQALPMAVGIARRANARLDLVEVHALYALEDPTAGWLRYEPDRDAEYQRHERNYLDATAKWVTAVSMVSASADLLAGSVVLPETVAGSILSRACAVNADLIVMATHGHGAASRFGLRSVAYELLRRAPMPILLMRPGDRVSRLIPEAVLDNILIPLDGSPLAEQVLAPAMELARIMEARCCLVRVVDFNSSPAGAEAYLGRIAEKIRDPGLQVRTRVVVGRHAAAAILEGTEIEESNLIALATHGRGGLKRLFLGSVADELVRTAGLPVLVYRPTGKEN